MWAHNSEEQHVISYFRRAGSEEFLIAVNLSNIPFRGTVEAVAEDWKEIELPVNKKQPAAIPSLSLDSFEARIFTRTVRQDHP